MPWSLSGHELIQMDGLWVVHFIRATLDLKSFFESSHYQSSTYVVSKLYLKFRQSIPNHGELHDEHDRQHFQRYW